MHVLTANLRDFRGYGRLEVQLGAGVTVISGANGAGKTNLLEALYFGCTGRSCRTNNEREVVRFGAGATRVVVLVADEHGPHELSVGFAPGQPKRLGCDGAPVERFEEGTRPLVSVFLPDRLELVKGVPALRRAHLDQFVAALWPARVATRRAYVQALAQRNALIARLRSGAGSPGALGTWNEQLGRCGIELMHDRRNAVESIQEDFALIAGELGLEGEVGLRYRPRSGASTGAELAQELAERTQSDLERGFTGHGPHRDELALTRERRELRVFGSQGQQRLGLLALLLAERNRLTAVRSAPPLMLLDDVMSELDGERRLALVDLLARSTGQVVITTTDAEHVPATAHGELSFVSIAGGQVVPEAVAA